jgi:hypothetical protein
VCVCVCVCVSVCVCARACVCRKPGERRSPQALIRRISASGRRDPARPGFPRGKRPGVDDSESPVRPVGMKRVVGRRLGEWEGEILRRPRRQLKGGMLQDAAAGRSSGGIDALEADFACI